MISERQLFPALVSGPNTEADRGKRYEISRCWYWYGLFNYWGCLRESSIKLLSARQLIKHRQCRWSSNECINFSFTVIHIMLHRCGARWTRLCWTMKTGSPPPNWLNSWSYCCGLKTSWTRRKWNILKWLTSAQGPSRTPSDPNGQKRLLSTSP